jgi:hypothetical protein
MSAGQTHLLHKKMYGNPGASWGFSYVKDDAEADIGATAGVFHL